MKMNKVALSLLAACIGFSGLSLASEREYSSYERTDESNEDRIKKYKRDKDHYRKYHPEVKDAGRLALNLVGRGNMYEKEVPDVTGDDQPDMASCFDVDLKNIEDGKVIGTATDCLSEIMEEGEGLKLIGTTFFNLPGGKIVTRGLTTVQPVLQDTTTPDGEEITHITGASGDKNSIIKATGKYHGLIGTVRLSGMVNLDDFAGVDTPIYFDCLFVIDLKKIKGKHPYWHKWYKDQHSPNFYNAHYGIEDDESENPYQDTGDFGDSYDDGEVTDPDEMTDDYEVTDPDEMTDEYAVTDPDESYDPYEATESDEESSDDKDDSVYSNYRY
ncbi:hypothetical protein [uncultured Photobacterium sp.]|uniref:hypothetical protein n=1 Tax=uncultured Photobacterium sp. TaxID=173973 RepID=UPI002612CAC0|nr:hypothetical protein [uncultured Photobacterium sp.]